MTLFAIPCVVFGCLGGQLCAGGDSVASGAEWIRPGDDGGLVWGIKGGIVLAVWPGDLEGKGMGGPRGLFRVGYDRDGVMKLVNFIAVEPVVAGNRGFSELEPSQHIARTATASRSGKLFWPMPQHPPPADAARPITVEQMRRLAIPGWMSEPAPGIHQLNVAFDIESFMNGAHPWIVASIREDRPHELAFTIHAAPDSAPMQSCILTATMGNYIRARHLWLRDRVAVSKQLWPDPQAAGVGPAGFTRDEFFDEASMHIAQDGSLIAAITTDEYDPAQATPSPKHWRYRARKVTQYWRTRPQPDHPVRIRVNGRFKYWLSNKPIPNGVAYENFELVRDFLDGRQVVFGVTEKAPPQLGLEAPAP